MKAPTEVKVFEVGEDGNYGVGTFASNPGKVAIVAQNAAGERRVILLDDNAMELAELARAVCEVAGVTKVHLKKRARHWDVELGPKPKRIWDKP